MKHRICVLLFVLSALSLNAQNAAPVRMEVGEENPHARFDEYMRERTFPDGKIPDGAYDRAWKYADAMRNKKGAAALMALQPQWRLIGPDNIGGRTRSVVCHPKKDGWVYVAAAGGGVWRTTNHGELWEPLFDKQNSITMGFLAIDPNNPEVLYAATGEVRPAAGDYQNHLGSGIYKSTDAGTTWKLMGLTTVASFSKIYVHPKNSNVVYAGGMRSAQGLYKSTDAGITWKRMNRLSISDLCLNNANVDELYIAVTSQGIFKSTDGGETINKISEGLPGTIGRITAQICQARPATIYTLFETLDPNDPTKSDFPAIYKTTDGGANWSSVIDNRPQLFRPGGNGNGQGDYDNFVCVHPTNPDICLVGGIEIYRTSNGGSLWVNVSNSYFGGNVHADQHHAAFNPLNPSEVYEANDGGMYRSTNGGESWEMINNGYSVSAFYAIGIDRKAENKTYGGTQDNGVLGSVTEKVQWETIHGGDGFYTVVDPRNSNIIYTENYNGSMVTVNVGNGSRTSNMQGIDDQETAAWSAPIVLDREGGGLYHGRKRVYLQILGTNRWEKYSPLLDTSTFISAIGPSSKSLDICWAGTQNGNLYLTKVGGEEWKNVSFKGLPKRWIRDVIASAKDERRAWVCYSGFGTGHIFRTDNLGESWTDISTVLPDVPVNAIVVHPQNEDVIMAGTDVGVFISYNNGGSWMPLGRGCPRSPVLDMEFYDEKNLLRIGTHGRSMWEVEVNAAAPVTEPEITSPMGGDVVMATASMVFSWSGFDGPVDVDVSYSNGEYWSKAATGVIGNSMRWVVQNRPTAYARIRVTSVTDKNKSMVSNTFTILEFTRGSVQTTTSVAHVAYGIAYDGNNGLWTTSFYTNKMYKLNATTMQIERELEMPAGNDKNFTDMTIDRERGHIYVHRLLDPSRDNTGARVVVVDTNGKLIRTMISPSYGYGIALELVDGKLIVGERNGSQKFYICNPNDAENPTSSVDIPFKEYYGPRCIAYDGKELIYLIGTQFSPGGGGLQAAYALRISKGNLAKEVERMELINSSGATINARGIEIDPRDNNYWITDLEGNIFKIANFSTKSDPLSDVKSETATLQSSGILIQPNPATNQAFIGYMTGTVNAYVSLEVYDVLGNRIATLVDGRITDDMNTAAVLDCSSLANGVYSVVLTVDGTRRPAEKLMIAR